jgi:hypothetical protein
MWGRTRKTGSQTARIRTLRNDLCAVQAIRANKQPSRSHPSCLPAFLPHRPTANWTGTGIASRASQTTAHPQLATPKLSICSRSVSLNLSIIRQVSDLTDIAPYDTAIVATRKRREADIRGFRPGRPRFGARKSRRSSRGGKGERNL